MLMNPERWKRIDQLYNETLSQKTDHIYLNCQERKERRDEIP